MTVKTITITERAYDQVKQLKRADESFSDLFNRLGKQHFKVSDALGILGPSPKAAQEFADRVKSIRSALHQGFMERTINAHPRLKRTH